MVDSEVVWTLLDDLDALILEKNRFADSGFDFGPSFGEAGN